VKIRVCSVEEASRILVEAGLESRQPYPGTVLAPWSIGCRTCSWRGIVQLHYLRQGNRPVCRCVPARPSGFDGGRSALLYVLRHDEHDAGKIGVMNEGTLRLNQHRTAGWIVVATTSFDEGWKAVAVERAVLRQLRGEGSAPFLAAGAMPYGGHTETFDLRRRSVASVQAMIGIEIARVGSPSHTIPCMSAARASRRRRCRRAGSAQKCRMHVVKQYLNFDTAAARRCITWMPTLQCQPDVCRTEASRPTSHRLDR
jgi:hypothetical protein